jgi:hypothetical protein
MCIFFICGQFIRQPASADRYRWFFVPEDGEAKVEQKRSLEVFEGANLALLTSFHKIIRGLICTDELSG